VEHRAAPFFSAGDLVPVTDGQGRPFSDALLETALGGGRALAIGGDPSLGLLLFRGTGNLGMVPSEASYLRRILAATRFSGSFSESLQTSPAVVSVQPSQSGDSSQVTISAQPSFRASRVYVQDKFPGELQLDQEGALAASHFVYSFEGSFARIWSLRRLRDAASVVEQGELPFAETALERMGAAADVSEDIGSVVLDLAFEPQLSIAAPGGASHTRGVVSVRVLVRDPEIEFVSCRIRDLSGQVVASDVYLFNPDEQKLGVAVGPIPVCRFPNLASGSYSLRVEGGKGDGRVVAEVPFVHDRVSP
jgi:hypothetical protein